MSIKNYFLLHKRDIIFSVLKFITSFLHDIDSVTSIPKIILKGMKYIEDNSQHSKENATLTDFLFLSVFQTYAWQILENALHTLSALS